MHAIALEIPEEVARSIRLPRGREKRILMQELALRLYEQGILGSVEAARMLAMQRLEFEKLLAENRIPIHADASELVSDLRNLDAF